MSGSRDVTLGGPQESSVAASELPLRAQRPTSHAVVAGWIIAAIASSVLVLALFGVWQLVSASKLTPASAASESASTPR